MMSSPLLKDLVYLVMQLLNEEKYNDTLHKLEQESKLFFNLKYFEELIMEGNWEEVERYLSAFTKVDDNRFSMKVFFEIRKQRYLEALDNRDRATAVDILCNDLKAFAYYNEELYKEITRLIVLEDFRQNVQLANYKDTNSARTNLVDEVKKLIEANPVFQDKLLFPNVKKSRLRMLLNQSLNWQHSLCVHPKPHPDIKTLFVDHKCPNSTEPRSAQPSSSNPPAPGPIQRAENYLPVSPPQTPSPPHQAPLPSWTPFLSSLPYPLIPVGGISFGASETPAPMPGSPAESSAAFRASSLGVPDRMLLGGTGPGQSPTASYNVSNEIPSLVARNLLQKSTATSLDFHPLHQTVLLVGASNGDFTVWEVSSGEILFSRQFQANVVNDPSVSVKRAIWSPDGNFLGVAFSKHIVQLYNAPGAGVIEEHVELDAHVGSVNDIAFSNPLNQMSIISCGDDKTIKVWDVATGAKLCAFEGHESAVYSICPQLKDNVHFIFSTSIDGKIKVWLYHMTGPRIDYDVPGGACATLAYTDDGERLFSGGTNKDGESHIVEWNEKEGTLKRIYQGFVKRSMGVVQFHTCRNKYLAVGDDHSIKIWDMDDTNMLAQLDAEGGLPASPRLRFNKDGNLMAVTANDNRVKILSTVDGLRLMRSCETRSTARTLTQMGSSRMMESSQPRTENVVPMSNNWKLTHITEPSQFQLLRLTSQVKIDKVARLKYTNSGTGIVALALNAIHIFWKWPRGDGPNSSEKASTKVAPKLIIPTSGILMVNDLVNSKPAQTVPCFDLSKNDSYLMSSSGGKVSLFNMMTFKTMASCMIPPPAATCLAFHPGDNNIIAIGMDDSTINIYNVRTDRVEKKLRGHSKRVIGLAFSNALNKLVSSGADSQVITWSSDTWDMQTNAFLLIPPRRTVMSDTQVEYHLDSIHLLAVNETQIAIYDSMNLECQKQWIAGETSGPITHATFSSDSQLVYSSFGDGTVRIFRASDLQIQCQISSSAYVPSDVSPTSMHPLVIAAHPQEPNQFALGLNDGGVIVFEPLESEGKWGIPPPEQARG